MELPVIRSIDHELCSWQNDIQQRVGLQHADCRDHLTVDTLPIHLCRISLPECYMNLNKQMVGGVNKLKFLRTVLVNKSLLTGTLKSYSSPLFKLIYEFSLTLVSQKYQPTPIGILRNCQLTIILILQFGPNLILCFSSHNPLKQWPAKRYNIFLSFGI